MSNTDSIIQEVLDLATKNRNVPGDVLLFALVIKELRELNQKLTEGASK